MHTTAPETAPDAPRAGGPRIGPVTLPLPAVLAPMAGYTDWALRSVCREQGCGLVYTEMVNAAGLVHGSRRTFHLLESQPAERPVAAHLYGSDAAILARAAAAVEKLGRFDLIDLNCGCPVRRIVARGEGAALMREPERVAAIVRAIREAVALPVTLKTRIGFVPDALVISELAHAAEEAGAAAIAIHARAASRGHGGDADWATIARIKSERRIPVIGNGGIQTAADAVAQLRASGADAVMIGRGAVGNPWIFAQIRELLAGREPAPVAPDERRAVVRRHLERQIELKVIECRLRRSRLPPEQAAVMQFRGCLILYVRGMPRCADVRRGLNALRTLDDTLRAFDRAMEP